MEMTTVTTGSNAVTTWLWLEPCPCCGTLSRISMCSEDCPDPIGSCENCGSRIDGCEADCAAGYFFPETPRDEDFLRAWFGQFKSEFSVDDLISRYRADW